MSQLVTLVIFPSTRSGSTAVEEVVPTYKEDAGASLNYDAAQTTPKILVFIYPYIRSGGASYSIYNIEYRLGNKPFFCCHLKYICIYEFFEIKTILTVAHKKKGISPFARSSVIASLSDSGERA